jgi:AraC-like DNA-binding protein
LANAMAAQWAAGGPRAAANFLVHALSGKSSEESDGAPPVHPQLRHALELVSSSAPGEIRIASVAGAVGLSPDYLGRLCKQQTGLSFSATTRWVRLLAGLRFLAGGGQSPMPRTWRDLPTVPMPTGRAGKWPVGLRALSRGRSTIRG